MEGLKQAFEAINKAFDSFQMSTEEFLKALRSIFGTVTKSYKNEGLAPKEFARRKYKRLFKADILRSQVNIKQKKNLPYQRRIY